MKLAIADPPYLGRAERWYGITGEDLFPGSKAVSNALDSMTLNFYDN